MKKLLALILALVLVFALAACGEEAPKTPDSDLLEEIKKLPVNYRMSIYLYYYEGYSVKEIAKIMGKSKLAVLQYLSRGRRELRKKLDTEGAYGAKAGEIYE